MNWPASNDHQNQGRILLFLNNNERICSRFIVFEGSSYCCFDLFSLECMKIIVISLPILKTFQAENSNLLHELLAIILLSDWHGPTQYEPTFDLSERRCSIILSVVASSNVASSEQTCLFAMPQERTGKNLTLVKLIAIGPYLRMSHSWYRCLIWKVMTSFVICLKSAAPSNW
jgi:hypothetical protein